MRSVQSAMVVALLLLGRSSCCWAQDGTGSLDAGSLAFPALLYEFRQIEEDDPNNTVFKVDSADLVLSSFSGVLNRVAEYQGLDSGVYLHNLLFVNSAGSGVITLEGDVAGRDSRRLFASYKDPGALEVKFSDTMVPHRLEHNAPGVDIDLRPGDVYQKSWERIEGEVKVGLSKGDPQVSLFANFDTQTRSGEHQHSFFQLHRFNCTDCHTMSASQGISQSTNSFRGGVEASLPNRTSLYAAFGGSRFNDNSSQLSYNFGTPIGNTLTGNFNSSDSTVQLQAYTGGESYRAGVNLYNLNRNGDLGQTFQGRYFSGNVAYQITNQFSVLGGYSSQDESNSLAANLSSARRSAYVELRGYPTNWLNMRMRLGQDDTNYNLGIGPLLTSGANADTHDRYMDMRVDARPEREIRLSARYRTDALNNPFFTTSPTQRNLIEASATWSPSPVVVGVNYRRLASSNSIYSNTEQTTSAYANAMIEPSTNLFATYSQTQINQNSQGPIVLQDALGLPLQLQVGYPYEANLNMFSLGADVAIDDLRVRPYYRRVGSQSQGLLLPGSLPSFTDDTRLDLVQDGWGLHFDLPAWENTALGLGYERQNWVDKIRSFNDGVVNFYTVNFRSRF